MTIQVKPWIDQAGKFVVEHIGGIPHFNQPVNLAAPRTGVVHTTEGSTIEGAMGVFRQHFAPHFLIGKSASGSVKIQQLVQVGTIGAALVSNNDHAIVQVEVAGFSKTALWLPDDETVDALASLMAVCKREYGIPLSHPWVDGDFGRGGDNDHRHAGKWGVVAGWYGHGDVPSVPGHSAETHWDPGALEWSKIFARAEAMTEETSAPAWTPPAEPPRPCACALGPIVAAPVPVSPSPPPLPLTPAQIAARAMQTAVKAFQTAAGLEPDGVPGRLTEAAYAHALEV